MVYREREVKLTLARTKIERGKELIDYYLEHFWYPDNFNSYVHALWETLGPLSTYERVMLENYISEKRRHQRRGR